MSSFVTDSITDWLKTFLVEGITKNFENMFENINQEVGNIANNIGQTPQGWNGEVFSFVKNISETVMIPIAGMVLTLVLSYELITMITEKNNMHDLDTYNLYKWIFKTFVAVYIVTHTFDIVMSIFDIAQHVVNRSASIISGNMDLKLTLTELESQLETMGLGELLGLWIESMLLQFVIKIMSVMVTLIAYGRMIEIYLVVSVAPLPFATMANREWSSIGNGYLKSLFALAFQGFIIMVSIAIYAVLVQGITASDNIHEAVWTSAMYSALLCFMLMKSGSLTKSIFGAH